MQHSDEERRQQTTAPDRLRIHWMAGHGHRSSKLLKRDAARQLVPGYLGRPIRRGERTISI